MIVPRDLGTRSLLLPACPRRRKKAIFIGTKLQLFSIVLCLLSLTACSAQPSVYSDTAATVTDGTPTPAASVFPSEVTEPTQPPTTRAPAPTEPTLLPTAAAPSNTDTTAPFADESRPAPTDASAAPSAPTEPTEPTLPDAPTSPPQTEHIHFFGQWHIVEADCLNDGYKERFCDCGEREVSLLPALGHDYIDGICSRCADTLIPDEPDDTPLVDTAYFLVTQQTLLDETLYFNGNASSGIYLATSADPAEAVTIFLEQAQDGYYLYFLRGEEKLYIDIVLSAAGKAWLKRVNEPSCIYVWDATHHTLVTTLGDHSFFLGSYDLNRTLSAIDAELITGENASAIGVNIFPAFLLPVEP